MAYEVTPKDVDELWAHPSPTTNRASTYNPQEAASYIVAAAQKRGIDPNVALGWHEAKGSINTPGMKALALGLSNCTTVVLRKVEMRSVD